MYNAHGYPSLHCAEIYNSASSNLASLALARLKLARVCLLTLDTPFVAEQVHPKCKYIYPNTQIYCVLSEDIDSNKPYHRGNSLLGFSCLLVWFFFLI